MGEVGANFILHPLIHTLPPKNLAQDVGSFLDGRKQVELP